MSNQPVDPSQSACPSAAVSTPSKSEEPGLFPAFRPGWTDYLVALFVLGAVFFYPLSLDIPLLDPDEGLHASIAQEIVERGDWIVPRLLGHAFWDKPIFYFWVQASSLRLLGMQEAAVRLPGLLFGLLGVLSTAWLGRRLFDSGTGFLAGLCYATMVLPASLVQAAAHDVALVLWTNLALLALWHMHTAATTARQLGYVLAAGFALGMSALTKGLVGVALVGVGFGGYLLLTGQLHGRVVLQGVGVLLVAALVAAPWYVAMEFRNPGYLYYFFVQRHFLGYLTARQWHGHHPWWYYLPVLLGGGLPWICYLPATAVESWRLIRSRAATTGTGAEPGTTRRALVLVWCWLIGGVAFFSLSKAKLVTYLWPVFPAVAMLAAVGWSRLFRGRLAPFARRVLAWTLVLSCAIGPVALPAAMAVVERKFGFRLGGEAYLFALPVALSGWLVLLFWWRGSFRRSLHTAYVSLALHLAFVMTVVIPPLSQKVTAKPLAEYFNRRGALPEQMMFIQGRVASFVFYLRPELREQLRRRPPQRKLLDEVAAELPEQVVAVVPERYAQPFQRHPAGKTRRPLRVGAYWLFVGPESATSPAVAHSPEQEPPPVRR